MTDRSSGYVYNWQSGKSLAECNRYMLDSEDACDVVFLVGQTKTRVSAHRYILISRSCVFYSMLCGRLAEKGEIQLPDISDTIFKDFLKFLYTDTTKITPTNVTGLLYLARKYAVGGLERLCGTNLESSLSAENACTILEQAHVFDEKALFDKAMDVVTEYGDLSLQSPGFTELCHDCLDKVITSDNLAVKAEEVFTSVLQWAEAECERQGRETTPDMKRLVLGESVFSISFPSMDMKEFVDIVVPSQILTHEEHTTLFSFFVRPELDVSPFKINRVHIHKKVVFYEDIQIVLLKSGASESVNITCSDDVTVQSLLVYAPKNQKPTIRVWFWKRSCGMFIMNDVTLRGTAMLGHPEICVLDLPKSVTLTKNTQCVFQVQLANSGLYYNIGRTLKSPVQLRNISINVSPYRGTPGLIAGLNLLPSARQ